MLLVMAATWPASSAFAGHVDAKYSHLHCLCGIRRAGVQVETGTDALYGYSPVAAALHAGRRGVQTLYVQDGGALLQRLASSMTMSESGRCSDTVEPPIAGQ